MNDVIYRVIGDLFTTVRPAVTVKAIVAVQGVEYNNGEAVHRVAHNLVYVSVDALVRDE